MEKELPKNWVEISFTNIFDINGGTQPPKAVFINEPKDGYIRLLQIRDFGSKPVPTYIPDTGKLMTCKKDDILIARYGASIGRIVTGMEGSYNVALAKVSIPERMNKNFVKWLLKSNLFQDPILSIQRTAQNGFNKTDLATILIPLPPFAEQNRIVAKLDSLLAQLESIKTSMAKIPVLLKNFRQQIIDVAFNLEYLKVSLDSICLKIQDGAHHSPKNTYDVQLENTFPYITSKNIRNNFMKLDNVQYVDSEFHNTIYPRCTPEYGDVLLTKDGASTGNVTLNELKIPFSLLSSVCLIKTNLKVLQPAFLKYYFQSTIGFNELIGEMTGTAIKRIVLKKIKSTQIPLPPIEEQQKIVSRVESLFAKADAIEEKYKSLKAKIETLPQTILHKAFKGELTEQLESDGDARDLLEEIAALKNVEKPKKVVSKNYVQPDEEVLRVVAESVARDYHTKVEKTPDWYDQRFELWVSQQGLAARGTLDKATLRELFDAMDDEDK